MSYRIVITPPLNTVVNALDDEELYGGPMRDYLEGLTKVGLTKAREKAKPHGGDTGVLADSIKSDITGGTIPTVGMVYSDLFYAEPANFGRNPGTAPPVSAILPWHGANGDPNKAFLIARAIGRRGTRGLHFFEAADELMTQRQPEFIDAMGDAIERGWAS